MTKPNQMLEELDQTYGDGKRARILMLFQTAVIIIVPIVGIYSVQTVDALVILLAIFGMMLINWISAVLGGMRETVTMERLEATGLKVQIVEKDQK